MIEFIQYMFQGKEILEFFIEELIKSGVTNIPRFSESFSNGNDDVQSGNNDVKALSNLETEPLNDRKSDENLTNLCKTETIKRNEDGLDYNLEQSVNSVSSRRKSSSHLVGSIQNSGMGSSFENCEC